MTSLINFYFSERSKFVKEYNQKTVLLMQVGSFYEILDKSDQESGDSAQNPCDGAQDPCDGGARKISQVLNIILTKKNKSIEDSPYMCGFPCVSLGKYLPILIANGYTVLKYDQVSETNRKLTEIFSPSTPPDSFETSSDPILMSIYIGDLNIGVSIANTATGDIEIGEFSSNDIINFLICRQPSEIILNGISHSQIGELMDFIAHKGIPFHDFIGKKSETIKEYLKASIQEEYIKKIYSSCQLDIGPGLLGYIVSFNLEQFSQTGNILSLMFMFDFLFAHNPRFLESPQVPKSFLSKHNFLHLESNTIEQLHIFEGSRNVFSIINCTQTVVGKRHLRWVLSNPFTDVAELNNRYSLTTKFLNLLDLNTIKKCLCDIKDIQTLQRSLICGRLSFSKFGLLHSSYTSIKTLCEIMENNLCFSAPFKSELIQFINEYSSCLKMENDKDLEENDLLPQVPFITGFDNKIDQLSNEIKESFNKLINLEKELSKKAQVKLTIFEDRYIFTTTNIRAELLKREKDLFFSSNKSGTKIWSDLTDQLSQQIFENKKILNDHVNYKYSLLQKEWGSKYKELFNKLVSFVGLIDVTYSNAICSKRFNYCCPKIMDNQSFFDAKDLRHPIIERLSEYIPNDICLGKKSVDTDNSLGKIIYSLNSGGKSSLLRSVGIAIILAQAGLFVPASDFSFFPFHKLISQVDFTDNLFNSRSSFVTEMMGLKSILAESDQSTLVLADELCKGSEINSATAIFASSICFLLSKRVKFLMSTHLHTVSKLPQIQSFVNSGDLQICNLQVRIDPKDNSIIFLRKLENGPCDTLYGLEIAKALGLNKIVITDAFQIRNRLVGNGEAVLSSKRSRYNKNKLMDSCEICGYSQVDPKRDLPLDCHHISFQCYATESGFCGTNNKGHVKIHSVDNLVCLCKSCHQKVHCGDINIKGYVLSTSGKKLEFNYV